MRMLCAMTSSIEALADLDPDDSRPASQQIASVLRAAIRTGLIKSGEQLPSQNDLSERYKVARETVKSALRILRDERLVVTRQGKGAFVRSVTEKPVGLRPHVESAFERSHVTIDFAGFSAETLHGALGEPLDKIRAGQLVPESVAIRILLPDMAVPMALPSLAAGGDDSADVRQRSSRIMRRHTEALFDAVEELAGLDLLKNVNIQLKLHSAAPLFKVYILNGEEVFFGFYPVVEHQVTIKGEQVAIYDPMGKDATLFHFAPTDDETSHDPLFVAQAQNWFNSVWETIARESVNA